MTRPITMEDGQVTVKRGKKINAGKTTDRVNRYGTQNNRKYFKIS